MSCIRSVGAVYIDDVCNNSTGKVITSSSFVYSALAELFVLVCYECSSAMLSLYGMVKPFVWSLPHLTFSVHNRRGVRFCFPHVRPRQQVNFLDVVSCFEQNSDLQRLCVHIVSKNAFHVTVVTYLHGCVPTRLTPILLFQGTTF